MCSRTDAGSGRPSSQGLRGRRLEALAGLAAGQDNQPQRGTERLLRFIESSHDLGPDKFIDALLDELSRWSEVPRGDGQKDDITILAIDFKSPSRSGKT